MPPHGPAHVHASQGASASTWTSTCPCFTGHWVGNVVAGTALEPGCGLPVAVLHGLDGSHEVGRGVIPEPDLLDYVLREQLGHVLTKYSGRVDTGQVHLDGTLREVDLGVIVNGVGHVIVKGH